MTNDGMVFSGNWFIDFFRECKAWSLSTAWYNLRWKVGYAIGPFHHACADADCSECLG